MIYIFISFNIYPNTPPSWLKERKNKKHLFTPASVCECASKRKRVPPRTRSTSISAPHRQSYNKYRLRL